MKRNTVKFVQKMLSLISTFALCSSMCLHFSAETKTIETLPEICKAELETIDISAKDGIITIKSDIKYKNTIYQIDSDITLHKIVTEDMQKGKIIANIVTDRQWPLVNFSIGKYGATLAFFDEELCKEESILRIAIKNETKNQIVSVETVAPEHIVKTADALDTTIDTRSDLYDPIIRNEFWAVYLHSMEAQAKGLIPQKDETENQGSPLNRDQTSHQNTLNESAGITEEPVETYHATTEMTSSPDQNIQTSQTMQAASDADITNESSSLATGCDVSDGANSETQNTDFYETSSSEQGSEPTYAEYPQELSTDQYNKEGKGQEAAPEDQSAGISESPHITEPEKSFSNKEEILLEPEIQALSDCCDSTTFSSTELRDIVWCIGESALKQPYKTYSQVPYVYNDIGYYAMTIPGIEASRGNPKHVKINIIAFKTVRTSGSGEDTTGGRSYYANCKFEITHNYIVDYGSIMTGYDFAVTGTNASQFVVQNLHIGMSADVLEGKPNTNYFHRMEVSGRAYPHIGTSFIRPTVNLCIGVHQANLVKVGKAVWDLAKVVKKSVTSDGVTSVQNWGKTPGENRNDNGGELLQVVSTSAEGSNKRFLKANDHNLELSTELKCPDRSITCNVHIALKFDIYDATFDYGSGVAMRKLYATLESYTNYIRL